MAQEVPEIMDSRVVLAAPGVILAGPEAEKEAKAGATLKYPPPVGLEDALSRETSDQDCASMAILLN